MPVLKVYIGAAAAQCVHLFLPLYELLYAELQEVQGSGVSSDANVDGKGGQQQQQHWGLQSTDPGSSTAGSGLAIETEGSLNACYRITQRAQKQKQKFFLELLACKIL